MAVNLVKGQKVDLTKGNSKLTTLVVGLGWDTNRYSGSADFDLDVTAFMLSQSGKVLYDDDFIFYGNLSHSSGSVIHTGDNLTGDGDGDDEQILVDLTKVPEVIQKIAFAVSIYDADVRRQNFGQVENSYIRIFDDQTGKELLRFDLGEDFSIETAIVAGEIYRHNGEWKFNAIGSGFTGGLEALCRNYGVNV